MTQIDNFHLAKRRFRNLAFILTVIFLSFFTLSSCASSSKFSLSNFSLEKSSQETHASAILTGSVSYGAGFYFPSSSDILDISLLKTDFVTGAISEISHQRIRNIQRFPLQFAIRYDSSELNEDDLCTLYVTLTSNDKSIAQGFVQLQIGNGSLSEVSVILSGISSVSNTSSNASSNTSSNANTATQ